MRKSSVLPILAGLVLPLNGGLVITAGYTRPSPVDVAPGQLITFYVQGAGAGLTTPTYASSLPLPTSLGGISAIFVQGVFSAPVPLISVRPISPCAYNTDPGCGSSYLAIRVQIPVGFDYSDPAVIRGVPVPGAQVRFFESGTVVASLDVTPLSDQVHVLRNCDDLLYNETSCAPMVTHADGSLVELRNPAKSGEEIIIYAVGLGVPESNVMAGQSPPFPIPVSVSISFDPRPNALASRSPSPSRPVFAGLVSGYAGLYQVNVIVPVLPPGSSRCDGNPVGISSNLTISIIGHSSFDAARICVAT